MTQKVKIHAARRKQEGLKDMLRAHIQKQRWLFLIFTAQGIELRRFLYFPTRKSLQELPPLVFRGISENNIVRSRLLKLAVRIMFFPFRYNVSVILPASVCRSKYLTLSFARRNDSVVSDRELNNFLSRAMWQNVEQNKKEFMESGKYDDLSVLLTDNLVVSAAVDGKSLDNPDDIFKVGGKKIALGVVHTFVYRPLFSGLLKLFPKRAVFRNFCEQGFCLPLFSLLLSHYSKTELKRNKKFVFASIREDETIIYAYDGQTLMRRDSFSFGSRCLYDAVHHVMGVDFGSYRKLLRAVVEGKVSGYMRNRILGVLGKELTRLYNGILSFKKTYGAGSVYLEGGSLNQLLLLHKKLSGSVTDASVISDDYISNLLALAISDYLKAEIEYAIGLNRRNETTVIATRPIRWLIPHGMGAR